MVERIISFPWAGKDDDKGPRKCSRCGKELGEDDMIIEVWKWNERRGVYCSWECREVQND